MIRVASHREARRRTFLTTTLRSASLPLPSPLSPSASSQAYNYPIKPIARCAPPPAPPTKAFSPKSISLTHTDAPLPPTQRRRTTAEISSLAVSPSDSAPAIARLASRAMSIPEEDEDDDADLADEEDEEDEEGAVAVAYGEGLAVLLSHLATNRRPQVQAWLQLKEDLVRADEDALHEEQGWDNVEDLEADFIVTNAQHLGKSWLVS